MQLTANFIIKPSDPSVLLPSLIQETSFASWMRSHFLKINHEKFHIFDVTTPSLTGHQMASRSVHICGSMIDANVCVRDLGVHYDATLSVNGCPHQDHLQNGLNIAKSILSENQGSISDEADHSLTQANVTYLSPQLLQ